MSVLAGGVDFFAGLGEMFGGTLRLVLAVFGGLVVISLTMATFRPRRR